MRNAATTVGYGSFSTPSSVTSSIASAIARNYLYKGITAQANEPNVISYVLVDLMRVEVHGELQWVIGIWLSAYRDVHVEPCGVVPLVGLRYFWNALGVYEGFHERLQEQWMKGNMVFAAPAFPVLSELVQMEIDISEITAEDIPALLRELDIGRANCADIWGQAVFDGLKKCATLALIQSDGIWLSPCW